MGAFDLSRPVEIWENKETGEFRTVPKVEALYNLSEAGRELVLDALRTGNLTALILPDVSRTLPASFWQWPEAMDIVKTGIWQDQRLAVNADEIRLIVAALDHAESERDVTEGGHEGAPNDAGAPTAAEAPFRTGAPGAPSSMHHVERRLEELVREGKSWPGKAEASRELHKWFKEHYPFSQPPTAKTIENRLRHRIPISEPTTRN